MFFLFPIAALTMLGLFASWRITKNEKGSDANDGWEIIIGVSGLIGIIIIIVAGCLFPLEYYNQLSDFFDLRKSVRVEKIYEKKAGALTSEFASYLAKSYPEYEKDIYQKIKPDGIDVYLVKYPELKSANTILALVSEISKLQADRYNQQIQQEEIKKKIYFRCHNPWNFWWWMPTLPKMERKYGQ